VHGKWVAYHDGGGWRSIVSSFRGDGSAFVSDYGPMRFAVPQFAHETATLEINNRWDIWSRSFISSPAMVFEITPENVLSGIAGRIDDDNPSQVWFDDAWGPGLSLRYTVWHGRAPRATREIVVDPARCPRGRDLQASWLVRSPNALTLIDGARPRNPDGSDWTGTPGDRADLPVSGASIHYFDGQVDPVRGSGFKGPRIWYWRDIDPVTGQGTLVSQPAQVTAEIVTADTIRLTKLVPQSLVDVAAAEGSLLITDDVQTIYPDPHAEVSSVDGWAQRFVAGQTWAQMVSGAGTNVIDDASYPLYGDSDKDGGSTWRYHRRTLLVFDSAALAGETATEAVVSMDASVATYSATTRLVQLASTSVTALQISDYENCGSTAQSDSVVWSGTGRQSHTLSAAGLSYLNSGIGGAVRFGVRRTEDATGETVGPGFTLGSPTWYSAEQSGTANDPYLEVTYGAAAGGGVSSSRCSYSLGMTLR
jgi:hypothetical protein